MSGKLAVGIVWHIKNIGASDIDNPTKPLLDLLKSGGVIEDDRYIYKLTLEKVKDDHEHIEIEITKLDS